MSRILTLPTLDTPICLWTVKCYKKKPTLGTWPERYIRMCVDQYPKGLMVYSNQASMQPRSTSIHDLTGCQVDDSQMETFTFSADLYKLIISGSEQGMLHPVVEFAFDTAAKRTVVADACRNLAAGREWNESAEDAQRKSEALTCAVRSTSPRPSFANHSVAPVATDLLAPHLASELRPALCDFFAAETAVLLGSPRHTLERMSKVALPSDNMDVDAAMTGVLRLLPNVSVELLLNYCGGAAKQGWMFKERQHYRSWQKRWFILWPQEAHPSFGRLLIYYASPSAATAKGAIQIFAPVVKAPKTPRMEHFCIRLDATKILDAHDTSAMRLQSRKFILGTAEEQSIKEWIELFRASGPVWKPNEVDPDYCSWLMKKGTGAMGWWVKHWVELRGDRLLLWDGTGDKTPKGRCKLEDYVLHIPTAQSRSRPNEFVLLPKVDTNAEGTKAKPVFFSADSREDLGLWKACLQEKMESADHAEAEQKLSSSPASMAVAASSRGPEQSPEDFDVMNVLGKGGFGKVLLVKKKRNGRNDELMAMKVMDKAFLLQQQQQQHTIDELNVMKRVQHPFMIALYNAFQNDASLFLVMEFMQGGDLYVTMQGLPENKFSEAEAQFIAAEVCLALCYLHELDIAFRDIKPENVLFDLEGHVRLIDFGLAKENISQTDRQTVCGTPIYMSPEMVRGMQQPGTQYTHPMAMDWWAFGVLIYEMVVGTSPFMARSIDRLMAKIANDDVNFPVGHAISPHCIDIIQRLLNKCEAQRLGSEDSSEVQRHDWFSKAGIDFAALYRKELKPVFVPEAILDDPLAHFPTHLTEQIVDKSDFQTPDKSYALKRAASRNEFAVSSSCSSY